MPESNVSKPADLTRAQVRDVKEAILLCQREYFARPTGNGYAAAVLGLRRVVGAEAEA